MPSIKLALFQKEYEEVYMYKFNYISNYGKKSGLGACHAFELPLVFKDKEFIFSKMIYGEEPKEDVERISNEMHETWKNFIIFGKSDGDKWPKFNGDDSIIRIFDKKTETKVLNRSKLMEVWKDMRFYEN